MSFTAIITADAKGFERAIDQAQAKIDGLEKTVGQRLSSIGDKFTDIGRKASVLSAAIVAAGGASFKMAADFQDALGATDQVYKQSSDTVKEWAQNLSSQYGIAKSEALSYSNLMGSMLVNIGQLTEEQAAKQSAKLIELAGDLTAMYGGTTQDAVRALTGALKGNNTMLDNYGMAVNDALVKTRALELGLIAQGEEMTLAARQAATLSLIWEQSAAAQGQAAREAEGASGSMRALQVEVKNLATSFGEILLPIITPIVSGIADMVNKIGSLSPELQKTIVVIGGIAAAIGPLMLGLGSLLKLAPLIGTAFTAMTGPIGIAVAAIAGATALIVANWDAIKEYFTSGDGAKVFETIKSMAVAIKDDVVTAFNAIKTAVKTIWNAIGDDIINIFGNALRIVMAALEVFVNTFKNVAQILHGIFTLDFKQALEGLKNLFNDIFNGIKKIVFSTISAISSALAGVFDFIGLDKWAEGLRSFSDKLSPSIEKVREETEKATEAATEAATVIEEVSDREVTAVSTASEKVVSATTSVSDTFTKLIGTNLSLQDSIRKTSDTIDELQSKLIKLQTGIISSTNVRDEIKTTQQQINDLSEALNLLTGGRELDLKVNAEMPTIAADMNKFFDGKNWTLPAIDSSVLQTSLAKANEVIIDYGNIMQSGITNIAGSIGEALGSGNFKDLGKGLIDAMGKLAQQFGSLLIGMGTAALHLQTTLITQPWLAIAAGAALVALGAAASAAASKMVNNATSGGGYDRSYSGGTSSYQQATPSYAPTEFRGPYQDNYTVEFKIGTNELVGVLDMADQRKKRL
jgi:hypothetical protein